MAYATIEEFKQMAFPSGSYNDIPDDTIAFYLSGATDQINSSLQRSHTLPLNKDNTSSIAFIKQGCITIASYNLTLFTGFRPDVLGDNDEVLQQQWAFWCEPEAGMLTLYRQGKARLQPEADNTPTKTEGRAKMYGKSSNIKDKEIG